MQLVSDPKAQNKSIKQELTQAIDHVIESGWYILGKKVEEFETEFANYCKVSTCVGVGNGTDAITLSLLALGIGAGDEVICPSLTATFTALGISATGAKPVFADIDEATFTIDPNDLKKRITKNTKAIIPVHLYGHPADIDPILEIAKGHGLYVIEDACQAHGAEYKGKRVGSIGDAGCFSFYPTKNLGALGDGGAITTNNPLIGEKIKMIRNGGQKTRYDHVVLGRNSRLDEIQAAILLIKLKHLDEWNQNRRKIAKKYAEGLAGVSLTLPLEKEWAKSVYHLFVVKSKNRDQLMEKLAKKGIQSQIHYPIPAHMQPIYNDGANLKTTEKVCDEILSLPIYPELETSSIDIIVDSILK